MTTTDATLPGGNRRHESKHDQGTAESSTQGDHLAVLDELGAYLLGALDPADEARVERHLGRCRTCAAEAHLAGAALDSCPPGRTDVSSDAVLPGDAVLPDDTAVTEPAAAGIPSNGNGGNGGGNNDGGLAELLSAALARRPVAPATVAHAASYAERVEVTGRVLAEFTDADWDRPTVEGWSARELVSHLAASDALFAVALGVHLDPAPGPHDTAESWTRVTQAAHRALTPRQVWRVWQQGTRQLLSATAKPRHSATALVEVDGWSTTVADHLTIRAFETWIHARDLARLVGIAVPDPRPQPLRTMADLALRLLHRPWHDELVSRGASAQPSGALAAAALIPARAASLEVRLTGSTSGRWLLTPSGVATIGEDSTNSHPASTAGPGSATILSVDATDVCLVVGARLSADVLSAGVYGDDEPARALLAVAHTLARP